jgi:enterochelin esterase-like enzyme
MKQHTASQTAAGRLADHTLDSEALGRPMRLRVYLPPYYGQFGMRYPVVYLLHQWGGDERYWTRLGLHQVADKLINTGTLPPFIAVMPQGDKSFFINAEDPGGDFSPLLKSDPEFFEGALDGYGNYGDYMLDEVVPFVEEHFETRTDRNSRVIAGISMGGAGAAALVFTHPERFGAVGIHSPALFSEDGYLGPPWIFGFGDPEAFAARDPAHLARRLSSADSPRIMLDCGQQDEFAGRVGELHWALVEAGVAHTYISRPGGHGREYWKAHLPQYLGFYAASW